MLIGKRLKELRENRKMTLKELSEQSGVQIATLSRIENLKMTGTLESHMQIAKALAVDITELYKEISGSPSDPEQAVERTKTESFAYNDKASYDILVNQVLAKKMLPIVLKIEPGGRTNTEQNRAGSERFLFVLEGSIIAYIGEKSFLISKHHTLYFDASIQHYFVNTGEKSAKVISVVTPVAL